MAIFWDCYWERSFGKNITDKPHTVQYLQVTWLAPEMMEVDALSPLTQLYSELRA